MQLGAGSFPFGRLNLYSFLYRISYFTSALLVSRVLFVDLTAPFGIAFLIAVFINENYKISLLCSCGTLLGYMTLYNNASCLPAYIVILGAITSADYIFKNAKMVQKLIISLTAVFIIMCSYKIFIFHLIFYISILNSFFETAIIFLLYIIINSSIVCFKEMKSRHLHKNEEIISMSILIFLVTAGTWGLELREISLRNVTALCIMLVIGYTKGSTTGMPCGIAAGIIMGIASNNIIAYAGAYGLCGMLAGVFRKYGKWITGISFLLGFEILKMYSDMESQFSFSECLISCLIFSLISTKTYYRLESSLECQEKQDELKTNNSDKIKEILLYKLDDFSDVLVNVSKLLEKLVNNDKLAMNGKSYALIENLGDRVCSSCDMKLKCWKREKHFTYIAFREMIQSLQEKKNTVPEEIERKCVKKTELLGNAGDLINNFVISEMCRKRLSRGRELLAGQINNIAESISEIAEDFESDINLNSSTERCIRKILNKNKIKFKDIFCYNDKNGRLVIKLSMDSCGKNEICIKSILPLINETAENSMCISESGCNINSKFQSCSIVFEETAKYHIDLCAKEICKDGEKYNGDSYSCCRLKDGTHMTVLSDGMGSGPAAKQESGAAVELIHKFSKSGFNKITAINTVNSIMSIKSSEEEKFSTLDICSVDPYNGDVDFIKIGAAASFIKTGRDVISIKSGTLPMGVLDKVDMDVIRKKVGNGDYIIMLSDGVLDYDNEAMGKEEWMTEFLKNCNFYSPDEMCSEILSKAKELSGGKIRDDMTVVVEKVCIIH
jgi:stage II sporulation protein E